MWFLILKLNESSGLIRIDIQIVNYIKIKCKLKLNLTIFYDLFTKCIFMIKFCIAWLFLLQQGYDGL